MYGINISYIEAIINQGSLILLKRLTRN